MPCDEEWGSFCMPNNLRSHQYHPIPCHSSFHWMSHPSSPPPPPPLIRNIHSYHHWCGHLWPGSVYPFRGFTDNWNVEGNHGVAPNPSWFSQFSIVLLLRASILDIVHFVWFDTKRRSLKIPGLETIQLDSTESKEYIKRNNFFFLIFFLFCLSFYQIFWFLVIPFSSAVGHWPN